MKYTLFHTQDALGGVYMNGPLPIETSTDFASLLNKCKSPGYIENERWEKYYPNEDMWLRGSEAIPTPPELMPITLDSDVWTLTGIGSSIEDAFIGCGMVSDYNIAPEDTTEIDRSLNNALEFVKENEGEYYFRTEQEAEEYLEEKHEEAGIYYAGVLVSSFTVRGVIEGLISKARQSEG